MSWFIENQQDDTDEHQIFGCVEYTIGRRDCDLNISEDKTVSRKHAVITLAPMKIPYSKSTLSLRDVSSYGTYVNRKKCDQSTSITLKEGDKIMFGSPKSTYWLRFKPLVVTSSCLKNPAKQKLEEIVKYFGGKVVSEWSSTCKYLVMDYLSITVKVICALASQCQIVTIDYFKSLKEACEKSLPYQNPKQFLPKLSPSFVVKHETFQPNPLRKNIFQGFTFYFFKYPQLKKLKMAIELSGGHCCLCQSSKNITDFTLLNEKSIVMQTEDIEEEWTSHVKSLLESHNKRMITDVEIGQAILCCTTDNYCNPNAALQKQFSQLESQTMAFQTQQSSTQTQATSMFCNRPNKPKKVENKQDSSTDVKTTESLFHSSNATESKTSTNKRSRSPNNLEDSDKDETTPSKKKSRLLPESVSDTVNPATSIDMEPSVPVLAADTMSQAPFVKPKPIIVIDDSDPEECMFENDDDEILKNVQEISSDKCKQSNVESCVMDSVLSEAVPEIPTPVYIKQEVVSSSYESKSNIKPFCLDLLSEDTQFKDRQEQGRESPSRFIDVYIKPGYLNTQLTKMNPLVKVKQEVIEDEELPIGADTVTFTNLVFRQPKPPVIKENPHSTDIPKGFAYYKGNLVHNFKKFCKSANSGACSLPRIIGGGDLVIHNSASGEELDDFFNETNEKESQDNEDNRRIEALFSWGPKKKGRRIC